MKLVNEVSLRLWFLLATACSFAPAAGINIEPKENGCLRRSTMDVAVTVDGEKFNLSPSCSFTNSFKTKGGNVCEVSAGMCSSFSPKNLFEVKCKDGSKASIPILCKTDSKILIESDQLACAKGRTSSMKITVVLRQQKFDFSPSCFFSFSKEFKTKEGIECNIKAGMCSSFSPKNKFEVLCEDGAKGSTDIQCP